MKVRLGLAILLFTSIGAQADEPKSNTPTVQSTITAPPPNPDQKITLSVRKLEKLLAVQKLQAEVDEILSEIQGQIKAAQPVPKAP